MPRYRITAGTFRDSDDSLKNPGDDIEMGEDIARQHAGSLELLAESAPAEVPSQAPAAA